MRVLIPTPLTNLPRIAETLGQDHEIVGAAGESESALLDAVPDVDVLVATGMDVSAAVIAAGGRLQVIGTPQVGVDRIDLDAATRAGVPVVSSQGLPAVAVAEFAVGMMLDLTRRISASDRALRQEGWRSRRQFAEPDQQLGRELRGTTVGVAGLGMIGSETARIVRSAFGCRVVGFDPVVSGEAMQDAGVEKFDRMLDEAAFADAVAHGRLAGGALDVYEDEPLAAGSPLLSLPNVLLTPHIAGVTHEWNEQRGLAFAERVQQVLDGRRPDGLANPDVWPAFERRRAALAV